MRILVFPWLLWAFLLRISSVSWVSGQCLDDQRSLLLQLNNSLVYNSAFSTKLVHWSPDVDCCRWSGVGCDSTGRVISLQLENETISDGIEDSSLFSLVHLERLNLAFNRFSSVEIPKGIQNLTNLTSLNLSNAGFGGQIPIELSALRSLTSLDLSTRFISFKPLKLENPNLRMLLENLTALTQLNLDSVNISVSGGDWFQVLSSSLPNLRILSLRGCGLNGPLDSLSQLKFLSVLHLDVNNLSTVPNSLTKLSNLSTLSMSTCSLQGNFPEMIFQLPTLVNLDLSNNVHLNGIIQKFPMRASVRTIDLSNTNFSGSLPDSLGYLSMLSSIDLSGCKFSGLIPSTISNLTELIYVDFSSNSFNGSIPPFHMSTKLRYLDLSRNHLNGSLSFEHFEGLANLEFINLGSNSLSGSIPFSLFSLPSLQQLQLSNNQFSNQIQELSPNFSSNLDTVDLSYNRLEGSIPNWFFRLEKLNVLSLSFNFLNGTMHLEMIQRLPNLTRLELGYNNLTVDVVTTNSGPSKFPPLTRLNLASCKVKDFPDLRGQSNLRFLDLSSNLIGGEIPNWIWDIGDLVFNHLNLSSNFLVGLQSPYKISNTLSVLDLHSNQFRGELPTPPTSAIYVDYSNNNFRGQFQLDTSNFTPPILFFSLANNSLSGEIPTWFCSASYLQVLDLSGNSLHGTIPPCLLQNDRSLGVLNLGRNNLSGDIPDHFVENCGLKTLDLSRNNLSGKIPSSLANCKSLEVVNVGNNNIDDMFPCMLNAVSSLRVLVLRSNKFSGNMTCSGIDQSWQNLQIIDVASNNFTGYLYPKYISSMTRMMEQTAGPNHLVFNVLTLNNFYYQDTVTVTMKGLESELVKILTVFTSIDFSSNNFQGEIPEEVGELKSLYVLNLSHNSLTGTIPKSIGNLKQLGSLDLSRNQLSGEIPLELASLSFLSFLNLSYNYLVGMIPIGTQLQTFTEDSFIGNPGLCGIPLSSCQHSVKTIPTLSELEFDWQFIITGLGYGVGAALVIAPLIFSKQWSKRSNKQVEQYLKLIFPRYRFSYVRYDGNLKAVQKIEDESTDDDKYCDEDESFPGKYCVFCTKFDTRRNNVIHNPKCTCHNTAHTVFSSSPTTSSSSILVVYRQIH